MAELTLHLVRHGTHCDHGRRLSGRCAHAPLVEEGWRQAHALADYFANAAPVDILQSSPRLRASQTAGVIGERLHQPLHIAHGWDEIDFGAWTGKEFAHLTDDPAWHLWNTARASTRPPGGESIAAMVTRVLHQIEGLRVMQALVAVCITHGDVIRGLVTHLRNLSADRMLEFEVDTGSVTTLVFREHGVELQALNRRLA